MAVEKRQSHCWWFGSHNSPKHSPWLHSTLSELDEKTKAMLELMEEDADSFAQRAEMYYNKRPELINMIEDLYRAHRSLAKRYDQLSNPSENLYYESCSDSFCSDKSEVDDPEQEFQVESKTKGVVSDEEGGSSDALRRMSEEIERLKEENGILRGELEVKDEEKREVIRQLALSLSILEEENAGMRKWIKESNIGLFDLKKLKKGIFSMKFFGGHL